MLPLHSCSTVARRRYAIEAIIMIIVKKPDSLKRFVRTTVAASHIKTAKIKKVILLVSTLTI